MSAAGLALGVRGIVGKEIRSRTRGWRPMLVLTFYLLVLTLVVVAVLAISVASSGIISPSLGQVLFAALVGGSVLLLAFIAPALTAGTISGERERRTLDLLLVTRASPLGLVLGKLAGAMLWVVYLLVASLPALGIVYLFGGVPPMHVVAALVVTMATALGYSALGLVLSAVFRRTAVATVLAYGVVLITTVLLPIVSTSLGITAAISSFYFPVGVPRLASSEAPPLGWPPATAWPTFFSPVMALVSVLGGLFNQPGLGMGGAVGPFSTYTVRYSAAGAAPESVTSLAAWVFNALISLAFAALALLVAAISLGPRPRWGRPRPRRRRGQHAD